MSTSYSFYFWTRLVKTTIRAKIATRALLRKLLLTVCGDVRSILIRDESITPTSVVRRRGRRGMQMMPENAINEVTGSSALPALAADWPILVALDLSLTTFGAIVALIRVGVYDTCTKPTSQSVTYEPCKECGWAQSRCCAA